jgi:hypothetical protein
MLMEEGVLRNQKKLNSKLSHRIAIDGISS